MFKLTKKEIAKMEFSIDVFEQASKDCKSLTDNACVVRDLTLNNKPCSIQFVISYVDTEYNVDDE